MAVRFDPTISIANATSPVQSHDDEETPLLQKNKGYGFYSSTEVQSSNLKTSFEKFVKEEKEADEVSWLIGVIIETEKNIKQLEIEKDNHVQEHRLPMEKMEAGISRAKKTKIQEIDAFRETLQELNSKLNSKKVPKNNV